MTPSLLLPAQASRFLSRWLAGNPSRAARLAAAAAAPLDRVALERLLDEELGNGAPLPAAMRRLRNLAIAVLIERDLSGRADLAEVLAATTALAELAVTRHLAALQAEMETAHGVPVGADSGRPQQLVVVGMGKLGGGELNVSSDIDLVFLYPEDGETRETAPDQRPLSNHEFFIRLGRRLIGAISEITEDGFTFRVDMALRPNGGSGPLAASFAMLEEYLVVQGREWERYAWVKARALTGANEDVAALEQIVQPFVYRRYLDFGAIDAMRAMHAQIRAEVVRQESRHPERAGNVKLGRGGIREIEFVAQVFQLIRGGRDAALRDRSTRAALDVLAQQQLLAPERVAALQEAYAFLRDLEHRIQYLDDAQTHNLPAGDEDRLAVARMAGFDGIAALMAELDRHRHCVATEFDTIFGEPAGDAPQDGAANMPPIGDCDSEDSMAAALAGIGFADPSGAARRLAATWQSPRLRSLPDASRGRLVALVNAALPLVADTAGADAAGPAQDAALGRLLDFLETVARRAAYLALLTEYPAALARLIRILRASGWAAGYLTRHPILLDELLDERTLHAAPDWEGFAADCRARLDTADGDAERQMDILREMHHAQLFRLLAKDLDGLLSVERLADYLSMLADILIELTIGAVWRTIPNRHREMPRFAVIAYGKLGGKELGYASDLDVVFLYDDDDQDAPPLYAKLAQRFITWMTSHTAAGVLFDVDIALRPDGASGLLVSSVGSFEKYQTQSAWIWEHQALTRARCCAGDAAIGARFEALRDAVLRQPRDAAVLRTAVLDMRARMRAQHRPRDGQFDLKQDAGGMIDIEFIVQYLILRDAARLPQLTADIGNIALLKLAGELGLIDAALASEVADAYRLFRRLQHQLRLQGEEHARVAGASVRRQSESVVRLWNAVLGPA